MIIAHFQAFLKEHMVFSPAILRYDLFMSNLITLTSCDLDGYLTEDDMKELDEIHQLYSSYLDECRLYDKNGENGNTLALLSRQSGKLLERITAQRERIHVYSFETPSEQHIEAGRIIARLRDPRTSHEEFIYYIQRAYELLFSHVYAAGRLKDKRPLIQKTPVTDPCTNYAVHMIPDIDSLIHDSVMCVMLRGALLPSMIISKEIQDYSSDAYLTPFALFRIKRDESCTESSMRYVLDLDKSFFNLDELDGKDLIFADPMNATGGSLVTIVKYLESTGIRIRSIKFINVISALKGAMRIARALPQAEIHTLWMDPVLNERAYILPGLGDAGDRLNGADGEEPRNIIQLIADYGQNIVNLYRNQVRKIEETVLS